MKLPTVHIKRILYATDLSENAVHAFSYAVSLANMYGARITILHVLVGFPGEDFVLNMIDTDTWKKIKLRHYSEARGKMIDRKRDHIAIQEVLHAFSEEVKADDRNQTFATGEILIRDGAPAEVIVETAKKQNCDLIIMGTHGHGVIADVLIGSTARWVTRHSPIPVLVIRLPKARS